MSHIRKEPIRLLEIGLGAFPLLLQSSLLGCKSLLILALVVHRIHFRFVYFLTDFGQYCFE